MVTEIAECPEVSGDTEIPKVPQQLPLECACVDTTHAASRCRCDGRASVNAACGISHASFAIRSSFVETVMEPDVAAIFPSNVPVFRCSLPSMGSLGLVPPLLRYCEELRLPAAPPALLRFLRSAVPPLSSYFAPPGARRSARGPGVIHRIPQSRFIDGNDRTSQVPGVTPLRTCRALRPRWDLSARPLPRFGVVFRQMDGVLPTITRISRLNRTARPFAVYASQGGLPHLHARLAFRRLASLTGRDWFPAGSQRKVSGHPILLPQASPGAP
jgi:hypothetical protein